MVQSADACRLLSSPPEIRLAIYGHLLHRVYISSYRTELEHYKNLRDSCRQIRGEVDSFFAKEAVAVCASGDDLRDTLLSSRWHRELARFSKISIEMLELSFARAFFGNPFDLFMIPSQAEQQLRSVGSAPACLAFKRFSGLREMKVFLPDTISTSHTDDEGVWRLRMVNDLLCSRTHPWLQSLPDLEIILETSEGTVIIRKVEDLLADTTATFFA